MNEENIKQIPEVQKIGEFIRNMSFEKQAVGGCKEEDVIEKIDKISDMFLEIIVSQQMLVAGLSQQVSTMRTGGATSAQPQAEQYKTAYMNLYAKCEKLVENYKALQAEHTKMKQQSDYYTTQNQILVGQLQEVEKNLQEERVKYSQQVANQIATLQSELDEMLNKSNTLLEKESNE